ncbi:MAG: metallophosphoesterase [Pseudomonadota bacterium]
MTKRILHLTDLHVFADRERVHYDVNPFTSLCEVIEIALAEHTPDTVLVSGDLCQDESRAGYELLQGILAALPCPVVTLPGNHDNASFMAEIFNEDNVYFLGRHAIGSWDIVAANCAVAGKVYGEFGEARLRALDELLGADNERPIVLSFHQPPVACGSAWLDQSMLRDADQLAALLTDHPQVQAIVCGHIHQDFEGTLRVGHRAIPVYASPSTARQFGVNHDPFTLTNDAPGWRWLTLDGDTLTTQVRRLPMINLND